MRDFILTGTGLQLLMSSILRKGSNYRVKVIGQGYSMSPFIKNNDTIILKSVNPIKKIKFGDIVAVSNSKKDKLVIHRIIRMKNGQFQTKGDNNPDADPWCTKDDIIGIVDEIIADSGSSYRCTHWQNILIAFASKTGLLNHIIYPGYQTFRNLIK